MLIQGLMLRIAQRPCSRCVTNGKEESCVDVQHKKRGRPRLRDDRDTRYDPSRFPHPQDAAARRPLSIYPSGVPVGPGYAGPLFTDWLCHFANHLNQRTHGSQVPRTNTEHRPYPLPSTFADCCQRWRARGFPKYEDGLCKDITGFY